MPKASQNNIQFRNPVVVVSLLDWGLGHMTRSVPIINHLIDINCKVIIACSSVQKSLLHREFSQVEFVDCPGYDINYGKSAFSTRLGLIFQAIKILIKIKGEKSWLDSFLMKKNVDLIISDNRYGFFSTEIPSVIITHQLQINTGLGNWVDKWVNRMNYRRLSKFRESWVPDFGDGLNAAGELSHPKQPPNFTVRYLGTISRLQQCKTARYKNGPILCILSGPEPQRTLLEKKIVLEASQHIDLPFVLIRGILSEEPPPINLSKNMTVYNHLPGSELNQLICTASYVVSRSGYTSIMDYLKLGVKSILIPTPGQSEQAYLARYMEQNKLAVFYTQNDFNLSESLDKAKSFQFNSFERDMDQYKKEITEFMESLSLH